MSGERQLRDLVGPDRAPDPARVFWRAATQRRETAVFLLNSRSNQTYLDAVYLAGYSVECALKSLILRRTPKRERALMLIELTSGARAHNHDVLSRILVVRGCQPPRSIREHLVALNEKWRTDLRYVGAIISYREAARFLEQVNAVYDWAEGSM